jgi:hypothetical protein
MSNFLSERGATEFGVRPDWNSFQNCSSLSSPYTENNHTPARGDGERPFKKTELLC